MAGPYVDLTDQFGRLLSRMVYLAGHHPPTGLQDEVVRDLIADVFDALYDSRDLMLCGKITSGLPTARRAYESLSLLHACSLDPSLAEKWEKGRQISNGEVRRALDAHPMGERADELRELYNFFCEGTHPNRGLVAGRFLGQGNQFVLGAIGRPDLILFAKFAMHHIDMWFWLSAISSYHFRELIVDHDRGCYDFYTRTRETAQEVKASLGENFNRLLAEQRASRAVG